MKKILIFSLAYYPRVGGAEIAIKEITDRLKDVEWHLLTLRFGSEPKRERLGNVMVHRIGWGSAYISKILFVPLAALKARTLHRQEKFDAQWVMMSYMLMPLVLANLRLPYTLTLQEGDTEQHMFGRLHILPFLPLIHSGFRHARIVQAISTYLGAWARNRGFRGKLEIIPNGVDVQKFAGESVPHEGTVLITSSRLVHKNGVDTVIRALPMLPDAQFVVCGTGPDELALKALARDLGVIDRVAWRGHVDHSDLPRHLHHADIFIRPSRSEGMGNSFVEAFAAGLPVVATQEGGITDFLFDAKRNPDKPTTGWAVDKENPEHVAAAVKDILKHPDRTSEVVARARALAEANYEWNLIAKQMEEKVFSQL